jgi:hypothetical protein
MTPDGAAGAGRGSCGATPGAADWRSVENGRNAGAGCTVPSPVFSTEAKKAESEAEDNMLRIIQNMC